MKRSMIVGAAALLLVGASYPIFALDSHKSNEPAKAVEKQDESKATEIKPSEPMAKDATATTPAVTETKPAAVTPSTPSVTDTVTDKAKESVKDKAVDAAKDKAVNAATGGMKVPSVPSVDPTAATKAATSTMPTTPNVTAPVAK